MIDSKGLFKIYSLKAWKRDKFQIGLSIAAISIAVAILIVLQLIIVFNEAYTTSNAKEANEGDINIQLLNSNISDAELSLLNNLNAEGYLSYSTSYKAQNNLAYNGISSMIYLKFVDPQYYPYDTKNAEYKDDLQGNGALINQAAADKYNLKKGDIFKVTIKGSSTNAVNFKVKNIIANNVVDESAFGAIIIDKSNLPKSKDIKTENIATNVHVFVKGKHKSEEVKKLLAQGFKDGVIINTIQDQIQKNKNMLEAESKALGLVKILVILITGTGISVTTFLLLVKRKKDYVLFNVYGMSQKLFKDIIIYETFMIAIIGDIIGSLLGFIIITFMELSILKDINFLTLLPQALLVIVLTTIFIAAQALIFTMLPIKMNKKINPISILREQKDNNMNTDDFVRSVIGMLLLLTLCFAVFIRSLFLGGMYASLIFIFTLIFYGLSILLINLVTKLKPRNKPLLLALRNLQRQKHKFALCSTALVFTLVLCGIIINLAYNVMPNVMNQYVDHIGYNLSLITSFDSKNEIISVLNKEKYVINYSETIDTTAALKNIISHSNSFSKQDRNTLFKYNSNPAVTAIDPHNDMLNKSVTFGRWFTPADSDKNYIVLGNNFYSSRVFPGDEIEFNIQGQPMKFKVIGICSYDMIRGNDYVYISINSLKRNTSINNYNSKLNYLIKCNTANEKELYTSLSKELKQSLILNYRSLFDQLTKFVQRLASIFTYACIISILSAVFLIGNILMIVNYERLKEFLILNVLGAKNKDIRKIISIEGFLIGILSGILGGFVCESANYFIMTGMFSSRYVSNIKIDAILTLASLILSICSSLIIISNMKVEKHVELLRAD